MTQRPVNKGARKRHSLLAIFAKPQDPGAVAEWRAQLGVTLLAFVVITAMLYQRPDAGDEGAASTVRTEDIARQEWQAAFSFETEDLHTTRQLREEAAGRAPVAYRVDGERVQNRARSLQERITLVKEQRERLDEAIREALLNSSPDQNADAIVADAVLAFARELLETEPAFQELEDAAPLAAWLAPTPESVPVRVFNGEDGGENGDVTLTSPTDEPVELAHATLLSAIARGSLEYVLAQGIMSPSVRSAATMDGDTRRILIVRDGDAEGLQQSEQRLLLEAPIPSDAVTMLRQRVHESLAAEDTDPDLRNQLAAAAIALARLDVRDTLVFDANTTENLREAARAAVDPVMKTVRRFELMQDKGRPWTEQSRSDVLTYLEQRPAGGATTASGLASIAACALFAGIAVLALLKTVPMVAATRSMARPYLYLALLTVCGVLVAGKIAAVFEPTGLVVPVMAAAVLLAILTNTRLAAMTVIVMAVLISVQYGYDWRLMVVVLAMSLTGVLSIYKVRRRSDIASAGFKATGAGLAAMLAVILATDSIFNEAALHGLLLIGLNGFAALFIIPGLLPPLERMFHITTDIQLLEYSDLNNEVLSQLALEVPATYSHSLMLGQLAEAAADAIGANGLLTRVMAYYHDIGKARRPGYFIENQTGANVHDGLSPRMSARAIASHVTEGARMAREHHLPKPLIDGILEHHGTMLISFFYQQALAQQKHGDVRDEDYRYPGPRPQSRETAILMICDGVESGIRSIKNPNEERVREFVAKIISARLEDRQFDQCDITLRDLDVIKEAVTKRVLTHYHRRIEYPTAPPTAGDPITNVIPIAGGSE